MRTTLRLSATATLAALLTAPVAAAQESGGQVPGQMMQGGDEMMGDDMSNMQAMTQMMGPMVELCTEMMAAMTEQMKSAPGGQGDNG